MEALAAAVARHKGGLRDLVHDLRSPLTALQLGTETLLEGAEGRFERLMLEQMLSDVGRLAEMLAAARAPETGAVDTLLDRDLEAAAAAARIRGVDVTLDTEVLDDAGAGLSPKDAAAMAQSAWTAAAMARDGSRIAFRLERENDGLVWEISVLAASQRPERSPGIDSVLPPEDGWTQAAPPGRPAPDAPRRYRLRLPQGPDATKPA